MNGHPLHIDRATCYPVSEELSWGAITTLLVFGALVVFASISTAYDLIKNDEPKNLKLFRKQRSERELLLTTSINVRTISAVLCEGCGGGGAVLYAWPLPIARPHGCAGPSLARPRVLLVGVLPADGPDLLAASAQHALNSAPVWCPPYAICLRACSTGRRVAAGTTVHTKLWLRGGPGPLQTLAVPVSHLPLLQFQEVVAAADITPQNVCTPAPIL